MDFSQPIPASDLPFVAPMPDSPVQCGFPSPADDVQVQSLDLASLLVRNRAATFFLRASGISMTKAGIDDGDLLVVDRAVEPRTGSIVVAVVDGEFTVKFLDLERGTRKVLRLRPASEEFADIVPKPDQTIEVWGVVTNIIKRLLV